jgi:hypothetical protein
MGSRSCGGCDPVSRRADAGAMGCRVVVVPGWKKMLQLLARGWMRWATSELGSVDPCSLYL